MFFSETWDGTNKPLLPLNSPPHPPQHPPKEDTMLAIIKQPSESMGAEIQCCKLGCFMNTLTKKPLQGWQITCTIHLLSHKNEENLLRKKIKAWLEMVNQYNSYIFGYFYWITFLFVSLFVLYMIGIIWLEIKNDHGKKKKAKTKLALEVCFNFIMVS